MHRDRRDWWKLAAVGGVALVVAWIGSSLASNFEPLEIPADEPIASRPVTTTEVTETTTLSLSTVVPSTGSTTTPTVALGPALLEFSVATINFGEVGKDEEVELTNISGTDASWAISTGHPGISVLPGDGEIASGESVVLAIGLDRSQIDEGEFNLTISVRWDDGEADLDLLAVNEDNPIIHSPVASPASLVANTGGSCNPTTTVISARVRDSSELESVVVRWSIGGGAVTQTAMTTTGDDIYRATIGPFSNDGSASAKILATDEFGNAGGFTMTIPVAVCP